MQAIYVPADDLTDPAPATASHLDDHGVVAADRRIGHLPGGGPARPTSRMLDPRIVGDDHYGVAREVQEVLQR